MFVDGTVSSASWTWKRKASIRECSDQSTTSRREGTRKLQAAFSVQTIAGKVLCLNRLPDMQSTFPLPLGESD